MKTWHEIRGFPLAIRLLLINQLGVNTGFYLLVPYLAVHLSEDLGMSAAVGVLFGVPFVGALVPIPMALGRGPIPGDTGTAPARQPLMAGAGSLAVVIGLTRLGALGFWIAGMAGIAPMANPIACGTPSR